MTNLKWLVEKCVNKDMVKIYNYLLAKGYTKVSQYAIDEIKFSCMYELNEDDICEIVETIVTESPNSIQ